MKIISFLFTFLFFAAGAFADITVKVVGEAKIVNDDLSAAKIKAEQRARWNAMEEAAQVKVTADTIIHDSVLLDESIKSQISGSIAAFKKLDEGKDGDVYWIQASVTVKPDSAKNILSAMAKNSTIAVYIPTVMISGEIEETHPFSEKLIEKLIDNGFEVVDLASNADGKFRGELLQAAQKNDMSKVRSLAVQFMAGSVLVGKLQIVDKGKDVGYVKIDFTIADGELSYRLIGEKDGGGRAILTSGAMSSRGQGATDKAAAYSLSKNMASNNSEQLASIVASKIMGDRKKTVRVVLVGNNDINKFNQFRDMLKNISWVLDVKETGIDSVTLSYPEKTMYLATIINNDGGYTVKSFTETEIKVAGH